jgi:two-component system response regulator HydG
MDRVAVDLERSIVGVSPAIVALREYLPKVARSRATVLIVGDTGTGKERVARAVHDLSPRRSGPFVAVNAAAMPDGLVEAELFGHERGAFTGAIGDAKGVFARADAGTLFLDEISEMSRHAQARLLRVLESREVTPVGAVRPVPVDVRVVAATNQPLEELVERGAFRRDLFFRLNVARMELTPLRERPEDIPPLLEHAIGELNRRDGCAVRPPEGECLRRLMEYEWPGNVRELRNLVEATFIDPPRGRIGLADLPPAFRRIFERHVGPSRQERDRMIDALEGANWNKAAAAKQLNCSRMTLYRRLKKYDVERSS